MDTSVTVGVINRLQQIVNSSEAAISEIFGSPFAEVMVNIHPSIMPLVRSHVYFDSTINIDRSRWSVSAVQDVSLWRFVVDAADINWRPILDYGDNGAVGVDPHGRRLVLSEGTRSLVAVDYDERKIYLVCSDARGIFVETYRVIRAIHAAYAMASGAVSLHASAVARFGRCVTFTGTKNAGKTSALLDCITGGLDEVAVLSNDRLFLHGPNLDSVMAWPSVVNAAAGSLSDCDLLQHVRPGYQIAGGGIGYLLQNLPLVEQVDELNGLSYPAKIRLTPEELRRLTGCSFAATGRLTAIIESSLQLSEAHSKVSLVTDPEEKIRIIKNNHIDVLANHPDWLGLQNWLMSSGTWGVDENSCQTTVPILKLVVGHDGKDVIRGLFHEFTQSKSLSEKFGDSTFLSPLPTFHFGVYARIRAEGRVLLVKKSRGPYTGLYDLPGGHPEIGEGYESALRRELQEEIGVSKVFINEFERLIVRARHDSKGNPINFIHEGAVADAVLMGERIPEGLRSVDTAGCEWVEEDSLDPASLSAFACAALLP